MRNHRCHFSVTKMCQGLQVSRSGFYAWVDRAPSRTAQRRPHRLSRIQAIWEQSGRRYGSPKITAPLRRDGDRVGTKTVAQLMQQHGMRSRVVRRYKATTHSRPRFPVADNVLAPQFVATRPHEVWMADITYVPTAEGWLYVASLEDLDTRKIVGWAAGSRMTQDLVLAALDQAVQRYRPPAGVLHHADRGSQYAARDDQARLARYHLRGSMSRKGNGWDNACIESWHRLLQKECVYLRRFQTRTEATQAIFEVHRDLLQPPAPPQCAGLSDAGGGRSQERRLEATHFGVSKFLTQVHISGPGWHLGPPYTKILARDIPKGKNGAERRSTLLPL